MKHITTLAVLVFIFFSAKSQVDSATAMKNWMEYMTPGKEHKMMASWDGNWNGEITMWMAPGAEPIKSMGNSTNKMIMDGRYQIANYEGNFGGMPMQGMSMLAFDKAKKVFISTWIDNMGTGMMVGEGPWDEATKSMTIKGTMIDPTTGKECAYRQVLKIIDNDHQVMEMFAPNPADGKEYRSMEIKYTRKK